MRLMRKQTKPMKGEETMNRIQILLAAAALAFAFAAPVGAADSVNINTADAATLSKGLNGIGMAKAEAIIAYRDEYGPFANADELENVKGIGASTVERNRDVITVGKRQPH